LQPADLLQVGAGEPALGDEDLLDRAPLRGHAELQHLRQLRRGPRLQRNGDLVLPGMYAPDGHWGDLSRHPGLQLLQLPQLQRDLLSRLHGGNLDRNLSHGSVGHHVRRLRLVLRLLQRELLPRLHSRVDGELRRNPGVQLLDVQRLELIPELLCERRLHLERVDPHLQRDDHPV
jgi:hypothetical protein